MALQQDVLETTPSVNVLPAFYKNPFLDVGTTLTPSYIVSVLSSLLTGCLRAIDADINSEESFYKFVELSKIDRCAFSYNWPYVIQATRGSGLYYQTTDGIVYFYFRKTRDDCHSYKLVIINRLGHESHRLVCELAEAAKKMAISTVIKNIDENEVSAWSTLGFKETIDPWSNYSFRDDNTFPEFVYSIKNFINLQVSPHTRSIINKFKRESDYRFIPYHTSLRADGLKLLKKMSEYLESKGVDFKEEVILAHQFVFDESIRNKSVFVILGNDDIIGLTCVTRFKETLFFNAIINENKSNLMRFLLWQTVAQYCSAVEESEWPIYLALQGSENAGQNNWKRLFHPIRRIQRTHVTNYY